VCQFLLSAKSGKPIATTNHKTGFQLKMRESYISYEFEWAFGYQFFAAEAPRILIRYILIFWLKPLKLVFAIYIKSNLEIKYQRFNVK
jgi:hypothetical protein